MRNKKGFTLIELLAVIIILGILMIIAIPAVTEYISSSRKNAYITTASRYIDGVRNKINAAEIPVYDKETTYYIPGSCVSMEKGGKSPYGDWEEYYVVVTYDGTGYDYYWTSRDETNTGIYLTYQDLLDVDRIENNVTSISTNIGVGDREKILLLKDSCSINDAEELVATSNIPEKGTSDGSETEEPGNITYKEEILNGTDPKLSGALIAVTIEDDGTVKKADTTSKWYSYEEKRWANAVILKDEGNSYNNGEVIPEEEIESYFVWIPKYSYKLWDLGNYSSSTTIDESKVHSIEIKFGTSNTSDTVEGECTTPKVSGESGNCEVGDYMTHPAFLAFNTTGMWVGKFETGYSGATSISGANKNTTEVNKVIVKPNVYSWRNIQVANAFTVSYNYKRELESHMMKNTEWGAVAYLSHSNYGINGEIRINNNSNYLTGYAAINEPTKDYPEYTDYGTSSSVTQAYNTSTGYLASTTGNITGVYDMSGGAHEYVMGVQVAESGLPLSGRHNIYNSGFNGTLGCPICDVGTVSGVDSSIISVINGINLPSSKYYDSYKVNSNGNMRNRILGDATGEMGPFGTIQTTGTTEQCGESGICNRPVGSWYGDTSSFVHASYPWFYRGSHYTYGSGSGVFFFIVSYGHAGSGVSFRLVLCI